MWQYQNTDELYHHGVLGMKWGVRRYQNADGTLTPAGRRKAGKLAKQYAKVTGRKLIVKKRSVQGNEQKSIHEMSDKELQQKINRFRLEETYKHMLASQVPKPQMTRGQKFINNIKRNVVTPALTDAGRTLLGNFIKKKGNDLIYKSNPSEFDKYKNKVNKLELQARELKAKNNIERGKKELERYTQKDRVIKNDLGTITVNKKKKK